MPGQRMRDSFRLAGVPYWTASLLPALVGTTLPFWLRPPGFSFRWLPAGEFLAATVLFHAGFAFVHARFERRATDAWPATRLVAAAVICVTAACLLGLHLNHGLRLGGSVHQGIFVLYGLATLFTGVLYVAPPLRFFRRMGGEVVVSEGLGMIPVLGAYLVQAGDLTRKVYLASLPLVVATALWVWMDELVTREDDERRGRRTMVVEFGARFAGRIGALALVTALGATLAGAVASAAMAPWALVGLLALGLGGRIVALSWREYANPARMMEARRRAVALHFVTCAIVVAASLMVPRG